jgi:hypothetical protein
MKTVFFAFVLLLSSLPVLAQEDTTAARIITDTVLINADTLPKRDTAISSQPRYNHYGDLLNDDPVYNKKAPVAAVSLRVLSANAFNYAFARWLFKYDWVSSGPKDWKYNFKMGPEWDVDGFGTNFIAHPYAGSIYFNAARSNGYSFWGSLPFAIQGSLTWEYLAENTRPSWNDLVNTPISGAFLGEALYRISSNVLDDRTTGANRFWREFFAALINPTRGFNRLTSGKMFRVTNKEVYQKEPVNVTLSAGLHKVNNKLGDDNKFATGQTNFILNTQLDYGDPFETRHRKPFDFFRLRAEFSYGEDRHLLDHINGYGVLAGGNLKENRLLGGLFQHFDFWHNNIFEVASIGFGGGLIAKIPVTKRSNIYSTLHLALVPLAGNNTQYGPVPSEFRQYNFGGGAQAKVEETINIGEWGRLGLIGFAYWIKTYNGLPGNSLVGILKPNIGLRLFRNLSLGLEHHIYYNRRKLDDVPILDLTRTEQKLFLQYFFEDRKRTGKFR